MLHHTFTCRQCGETLKGRRDKKFCDDQCRSQFNNLANSENSAAMRGINSILKRNRKILSLFLQNNTRCSVSLQKLIAAGLHTDFVTHLVPARNGSTYRFCYEFGYQIVKGEEARLVKLDGAEPHSTLFIASTRARR